MGIDVVTLALAKAQAKKISAQYESVGIVDLVTYADGFKATLANGDVEIIPIEGWYNLTQTQRDTLAKLVPISNDNGATYIGTNLAHYPVQGFNQTNDNKSYSFIFSDWTKVSEDEYYKDIKHGKNNLNIIPTIVNDSNEGCTEGWKIIDADTIRITSTSPFSGRVILNYSVSNSNALNNIATVGSSYIFTTIVDRDTYFGTTNINALTNGLVSIIKDGTTEILYTWEGEDKPSTYNANLWHNSTALLKGEKGDIGSIPEHQWNNTSLAFQKPNLTWGDYVNLKGDTGSAGTKLNARGTYDPLIEYKVDSNSMDVVNYNGKAYACLQTNTGKQPDISDDYWALLLDSVLSVNDWVLDTTSEYPILKLKTPDEKLYNIAKNGDDNDCIVFGDITRATHIDSSTDIMLGKLEQDNDLSFDVNSDATETKSTISCTFEITPTIKGYATAISMNLANVQSNTQAYFTIKDKESNSIIYEDNISLTDFTNGVDEKAYNVINGEQTISLHKIFSLTMNKVHEITFTFNKTVTIKGKTVNSVFLPYSKLTVKGMSLESLATKEWTLKSGLYQIEDSLSPNGMKNMDNTVIHFDDSTRTFSIKPKDGVSYTYYVIGARVVVTEEKTIQIPNTTGVYYICIDGTGTLSYSSSYSVDDYSKLPLLFIRWNSDLNSAESQWDMRIGNLWLDVKTRSYMLNTTGVLYDNGFQIVNTLNGDGSSDSQAQISLSDGSFKIAERQFLISNSSSPVNSFENKMSPILYSKMFYRLGNSNDFIVDSLSNFPLKKELALPYYNKNTSGTWSLTEATSGNYITSFIGVNTDIRPDGNFFTIMGQWQDTTLLNARANQIYQNLDLGNLNKKSCKILYKLIYKVSSTYANNIKATLVEVEDLRSIASIEVTASTTLEHNSLVGRDNPHAHKSDAIDFVNITPLIDGDNAIKITNKDRTKTIMTFDTNNEYVSVTGDRDAYVQMNVKNSNLGISASSDIVASNDSSTETTHFIDMGINSSTYNDPTFTIAKSNEAYIYSKDADISIGTGTDGKVLKFFTDNALEANERMRISKTGLIMKSPLGYYSVTTTQRLALVTSVPPLIEVGGVVYDNELGCNIQYIGDSMWVQL